MNKNKLLVSLNTFTLVLMLFFNYASNAGIFSSANFGDISNKYDTLFAPAGYAFSIWGIIFLMCIVFVLYQWRLLKKGDPKEYIKRTGWWFMISNLANASWLYCWLNEWLGLSVALILLLLFCLVMLTLRLRLELDDEPLRTIFYVWWPVAIYLGWIMVATIACIAAWLVSTNWIGGSLGQVFWTIVMVVVATLLYLILIFKRNLRESAIVGVWAFIGIAVKQQHSNPNLTLTASICAAVLLIAVSIHAFKFRDYNIAVKLKKGEW